MDQRQYFDYLSAFIDADKALSAEIKDTIRINTLKISKEEFFEITSLDLEKTFYEYGFYAKYGARLGASWEYFLGYMHTQSLSSMLPALILNPGEHDLVLDAASAPGSKTSHLSMLMKNKGAILATEISWEKCSVLFSNITRLGVLNAKVALRDAKNIGVKNYFTKALLDAPCSALSHPGAIRRFSPNISQFLAKVQKKMILSVYDSLAGGGELVYSTCTYSKDENEEVVKFLLEERPEAKLIDLEPEFPHDSGLSEYGNEFRKAARIYPFHFNSEGFFIAKIKKSD